MMFREIYICSLTILLTFAGHVSAKDLVTRECEKTYEIMESSKEKFLKDFQDSSQLLVKSWRDENCKSKDVPNNCLTDVEARLNQAFDLSNQIVLGCIESVWKEEVTKIDNLCNAKQLEKLHDNKEDLLKYHRGLNNCHETNFNNLTLELKCLVPRAQQCDVNWHENELQSSLCEKAYRKIDEKKDEFLKNFQAVATSHIESWRNSKITTPLFKKSIEVPPNKSCLTELEALLGEKIDLIHVKAEKCFVVEWIRTTLSYDKLCKQQQQDKLSYEAWNNEQAMRNCLKNNVDEIILVLDSFQEQASNCIVDLDSIK